jgi:pimeloyl-ACP methyl ester carboxylesterase
MRRFDESVDVSGSVGEPAVMVGSRYEADDGEPSPLLFVGLPGGTSNRFYFDLDCPGGYSFASHVAAHGHSFVAFDHLGTGQSTQPDCEVGLEMQADALADAVGQLGGAADRFVVGVAHSMGGYTAMLQQAAHRSYDALAILGTTNQWVAPLDFGAYSDSAPSMLADLVEEAAAGSEARRAIADRTMAGFPERYFVPDREPMRHWSHLPDVPGSVIEAAAAQTLSPVARRTAAESTVPGITVDAAARIDVPVLLAFGEIDVSPDPHREPATYASCPDVTLLVLAGSAHCHNFSAVRTSLWERIVAWAEVIERAPITGRRSRSDR